MISKDTAIGLPLPVHREASSPKDQASAVNRPFLRALIQMDKTFKLSGILKCSCLKTVGTGVSISMSKSKQSPTSPYKEMQHRKIRKVRFGKKNLLK